MNRAPTQKRIADLRAPIRRHDRPSSPPVGPIPRGLQRRLPISSNLSRDLEASNDTHKFESRYNYRLIAAWPVGREIYRQRSPIHFLEKLNCPIIFFQGDRKSTR